MQVIGLHSTKIKYSKQNFKGTNANFATSASFPGFTDYTPIPLDTYKAYSPINQNYKPIETFSIPGIGEGNSYELSNGHKVIILPKSGPTVINTYVKAGYSKEPIEKKETSHLLEHLMGNAFFKSNDNTFAKLGSMSNAATSFIYTNYYSQTAVNNNEDLEDLIKAQAKVLTDTNFTENDVEKEKDIIKQELSSKNQFNSDNQLKFRLTLKNLFNLDDSDNIMYPTSPQSINNITKQDLLDYHNNFYNPSNMVTVIIGDVDKNTINTFSKHFGQIKNQNTDTNAKYKDLQVNNPIEKTVRTDVRSYNKNEIMTNSIISFIGPKNSDSKEKLMIAAMEHAVDLKIDNYSKETGDNLKFNTYTNQVSLQKDAPLVISIEGESFNSDTEDNLKALYSILTDISNNKISEKELNKIKTKMKNNASILNEDGHVLSSILGEAAITSQSLNEAREISIIDSLTTEDIQNTVKKYINLNKASLVVVHPKENRQTLDSKAFKPTFTGSTDILTSNTNLNEYVLPNNVRLIIDSRPGITRSAVKLDIHSKKNLYNNTEATMDLLESLESPKLKEELENKGIFGDFDGNSQQIIAKLSGTPDKTTQMLSYAISSLLNPNIDPVRIYEKQQKAKTAEKSIPKQTIYDKIEDELFGESPYVYKKGDLKNLTVKDVQNQHKQLIENSQCTAYITLPQEELAKNKNQIIEMLMKIPAMQNFDNSAVKSNVIAKPLEKNKVLIKEKDNDQIQINRIYKLIESGNINDTAGLLILNILLGGSESSKIFKHLRLEDRISYAASSNIDLFTPIGNIAELEVSTKVAADNDKNNLKIALEDFDKSINEVTQKPVSDTDLENAKAIIKNIILNELETTEKRNNFIAKGYNTPYGINFQTELIKAIDNTNAEQVQKLAKYYLNKPYILSISGNADAIESNKDYLSKIGDIEKF